LYIFLQYLTIENTLVRIGRGNPEDFFAQFDFPLTFKKIKEHNEMVKRWVGIATDFAKVLFLGTLQEKKTIKEYTDLFTYEQQKAELIYRLSQAQCIVQELEENTEDSEAKKINQDLKNFISRLCACAENTEGAIVSFAQKQETAQQIEEFNEDDFLSFIEHRSYLHPKYPELYKKIEQLWSAFFSEKTLLKFRQKKQSFLYLRDSLKMTFPDLIEKWVLDISGRNAQKIFHLQTEIHQSFAQSDNPNIILERHRKFIQLMECASAFNGKRQIARWQFLINIENHLLHQLIICEDNELLKAYFSLNFSTTWYERLFYKSKCENNHHKARQIQKRLRKEILNRFCQLSIEKAHHFIAEMLTHLSQLTDKESSFELGLEIGLFFDLYKTMFAFSAVRSPEATAKQIAKRTQANTIILKFNQLITEKKLPISTITSLETNISRRSKSERMSRSPRKSLRISAKNETDSEIFSSQTQWLKSTQEALAESKIKKEDEEVARKIVTQSNLSLEATQQIIEPIVSKTPRVNKMFQAHIKENPVYSVSPPQQQTMPSNTLNKEMYLQSFFMVIEKTRRKEFFLKQKEGIYAIAETADVKILVDKLLLAYRIGALALESGMVQPKLSKKDELILSATEGVGALVSLAVPVVGHFTNVLCRVVRTAKLMKQEKETMQFAANATFPTHEIEKIFDRVTTLIILRTSHLIQNLKIAEEGTELLAQSLAKKISLLLCSGLILKVEKSREENIDLLLKAVEQPIAQQEELMVLLRQIGDEEILEELQNLDKTMLKTRDVFNHQMSVSELLIQATHPHPFESLGEPINFANAFAFPPAPLTSSAQHFLPSDNTLRLENQANSPSVEWDLNSRVKKREEILLQSVQKKQGNKVTVQSPRSSSAKKTPSIQRIQSIELSQQQSLLQEQSPHSPSFIRFNRNFDYPNSSKKTRPSSIYLTPKKPPVSELQESTLLSTAFSSTPARASSSSSSSSVSPRQEKDFSVIIKVNYPYQELVTSEINFIRMNKIFFSLLSEERTQEELLACILAHSEKSHLTPSSTKSTTQAKVAPPDFQNFVATTTSFFRHSLSLPQMETTSDLLETHKAHFSFFINLFVECYEPQVAFDETYLAGSQLNTKEESVLNQQLNQLAEYYRSDYMSEKAASLISISKYLACMQDYVQKNKVAFEQFFSRKGLVFLNFNDFLGKCVQRTQILRNLMGEIIKPFNDTAWEQEPSVQNVKQTIHFIEDVLHSANQSSSVDQKEKPMTLEAYYEACLNHSPVTPLKH